MKDLQTGMQIGIGHKNDGLYELDHLHIPDVAAMTSSPYLSPFRLSFKSVMFYLWHSCLGHMSKTRLQYLGPVCFVAKRRKS